MLWPTTRRRRWPMCLHLDAASSPRNISRQHRNTQRRRERIIALAVDLFPPSFAGLSRELRDMTYTRALLRIYDRNHPPHRRARRQSGNRPHPSQHLPLRQSRVWSQHGRRPLEYVCTARSAGSSVGRNASIRSICPGIRTRRMRN